MVRYCMYVWEEISYDYFEDNVILPYINNSVRTRKERFNLNILHYLYVELM